MSEGSETASAPRDDALLVCPREREKGKKGGTGPTAEYQTTAATATATVGYILHAKEHNFGFGSGWGDGWTIVMAFCSA